MKKVLIGIAAVIVLFFILFLVIACKLERFEEALRKKRNTI